MTIADLITEIRLDLTDKDKTRWTDADMLILVKKAGRRLQHILFRNDIQAGKVPYTITTVAGTNAYALPSDFMTDVGMWRDDGLLLEKLTDARFYGATSGSECVAYYVLDKIYIYAMPASERTLTLLYWPRIDLSTDTSSVSSAWIGSDGAFQILGSDWTPGSATPWGGKFDDLLIEYVIFRCKNADEMDVSEEKALLADMENNILATYGTVAPTIVRQRGWLP